MSPKYLWVLGLCLIAASWSAMAQSPDDLGVEPLQIGPFNVWNTDYPNATFEVDGGVTLTLKNGEGHAGSFDYELHGVSYGLVDDPVNPRALAQFMVMCNVADDCGNASFQVVMLLTAMIDDSDAGRHPKTLASATIDGHIRAVAVDPKTHDIVVEAMTYGPEDDRANPTRRKLLFYRYTPGKKQLLEQRSVVLEWGEAR
jgi:hypothetical protein